MSQNSELIVQITILSLVGTSVLLYYKSKLTPILSLFSAVITIIGHDNPYIYHGVKMQKEEEFTR